MTSDNTSAKASPKVYIIHENGDWLATLRAALTEAGIPFEEWDVGTTHSTMDMSVAPPEGVFYNIVSPSSHKRGHRFAMEMGASIVAWLEHHGRRVVNGSQALNLELSKVRQDLLLERFGIAKPNTVACIGRDGIISSIQRYRTTEEGGEDTPFLLKHNRGGSGLGVRLFRSVDSAEAYVRSEEEFLESVDGITLVTDFVDSPEAALYRLEFVNGRHMYSVRVDTSAVVNADSSGPINNCPADSCNVKKGASGGKKATSEKEQKTEEPETKREPDALEIDEVDDEDDFDGKAAAGADAGKAAVVYFGASWCKNCRVLKPSVQRLAGEFADSAVFMQADVDEANDLAERLEVTNIPHVAVVRDGQVVATHTGADSSALKATLAGALGAIPAVAPGTLVQVEDDDEFDENMADAVAADKLGVVYFGASWCKNCRVLKPSVKQFAGEFAESAVFMEADVDEASDLAERLDVTNIPHVAVVRNGEVVATHTGADADALKAKLVEALGESSSTVDDDTQIVQEHNEREEQGAEADTGKEIGNCPLKASLDKFRIIKDFHHPVIPKLESMVQSFDSGVSGIEIIIDADNEAYVIDVNCINTNYNTRAEAAAGLGAGYGIARVRDLLISELRVHYPHHYSVAETIAEEDTETKTETESDEIVPVSSDSEGDWSEDDVSDEELPQGQEESEEVTLTLSPLLDTSELSEKLRQLQTAQGATSVVTKPQKYDGERDPTDVSPERTPTLSYYNAPKSQAVSSRPTNFWLDSLSVY